jgi:uncharacterized protein YchJ
MSNSEQWAKGKKYLVQCWEPNQSLSLMSDVMRLSCRFIRLEGVKTHKSTTHATENEEFINSVHLFGSENMVKN